MTQLAPAAGLALLAAVMAVGFVRMHRRQAAVADTELVRTDEIGEGMVKLKGTIDPVETVRSPVTGGEVVAVDWRLRGEAHDEERPQKDVRGRRAAAFDLVDDHGSVRVDPDGADLSVSAGNSVSTWDEPAERDTLKAFANEIEDDLAMGGDEREHVTVEASGSLSVSGYKSTYRNARYEHEALTPGDEITVLGHATEVDGEFVVGEGDGPFVLSDQSEDVIESSYATQKWILLAVGGASAVGSLYFLI